MSVLLLADLSEVLDRLKQEPSQSPQRIETSDTGGDETDANKGRRKILSKKIFRMKKVYAANELGRFFVTGPSDAANMPRHFACDQRLRLETPGWRVLAFHGNPLSEAELERQRKKIRTGPFLVRDREHPFAEDLITDEAGVVDPQLPVLTKVSCLVDALKMGGSYGLIEKLWAQFVLTVGPMNTEVAWTRDEVLVGSVDFRNHFVSFLIHIVVLLLVLHRYWNAAPNFVAIAWVGQGSQFLQPWIRGVWWVIVGLYAGMGERHFPLGCCYWYRPFCRWRYTRVISARVSCGAAVGGFASLVAVSGGLHVLANTYGDYLGSGYSHKLVEYPVFDLRLLKRCLQKVSSSVFGSLDPFSMTEFIVTRLKGAEHRDWMMSRFSLRCASITGQLSMPSLVEVFSDIMGV